MGLAHAYERKSFLPAFNSPAGLLLIFGGAYIALSAVLMGIAEFTENQSALEEMGYHRCACENEYHDCYVILTPIYPFPTCATCTFGQCYLKYHA